MLIANTHLYHGLVWFVYVCMHTVQFEVNSVKHSEIHCKKKPYDKQSLYGITSNCAAVSVSPLRRLPLLFSLSLFISSAHPSVTAETIIDIRLESIYESKRM